MSCHVMSQVAHSGSSEGSSEPFGASRGTVDETEENGASSCGSGGGGRQHNVQAAFEVLDAAVGRGGGGGEASNGSSGNGNGAGYDGYAIGSDVHDAVRNGGVEVEAQRFGCPVPASVPASAFFGEDLPVSKPYFPMHNYTGGRDGVVSLSRRVRPGRVGSGPVHCSCSFYVLIN